MSESSAFSRRHSAQVAGQSPVLICPDSRAIVKISKNGRRLPSGCTTRQEANACTGPYTSSTVKPSKSATATRRIDGVSVMTSLLSGPRVFLGGLLVELGAPARRGRDLHPAVLDLRQRREQLVAVRRLLGVTLHDPHVRHGGAEVEALERAQMAVVVVGRDVQLVGLGQVGHLLRGREALPLA